jgi:heme-degrading monooxygenase HmoA
MEVFGASMTEPDNLIVRTWSATATPTGAQNYRQYFANTLLPQLHDRAGFVGGYLLMRELDNQDRTVELTVHTLWQSAESIQTFAGEDATVSIVEPDARRMLLDFDATATHRTLWVGDRR